jgi:RNA polymerase sigma factor (sigma-70 family)
MSAGTPAVLGPEPFELDLVAKAKAGDQGAFERLLVAALRPATSLAFAMLHDRSEAEDAFQEASLRAWRRLDNLRPGTRFQPWFIGIVANQCREVRRGRWWGIARVPAGIEASQGAGTLTWFEGEELRQAVAALPRDQRLAVLMHFHLDMPLSDVGTALGISAVGAKTRIHRALKRLRPALGAAEVRVNG